jgi:FkbM family methyltransferase
MIQRISQLIGTPARDFIYDVLRFSPPALSVDIGAAAGAVALKIHHMNPGKCRVVAFEPFPGNFVHFERNVGTLPHITLIKKAVSDQPGTAQFYVPSQVEGSEAGWESQVGYSSVGYLVNAAPSGVSRLRRYAQIAKRMTLGVLKNDRRSSMLRVKTTTIDLEFPAEKINFLKIDVQGAEAKVLRGAVNKLRHHAVDLLYAEWTGDHEVVDILAQNGYRIYDSTYIAGLKRPDPKPVEELGFRFLSHVPLSTGESAFEFYLSPDGPDPAEAIAGVQRRQLGWIQTDLIAVSPGYAPVFTEGLSRYMREKT